MKINNYNKLPQGINDIADLKIHEASMLVGAAIKTLSDLKPHWEEEVQDLLDLYLTLRRELPEKANGKHVGHDDAHESIKYGAIAVYSDYGKGAAGL